MEKIITERLSFLNPTKLKIINESHLHQGHSGNNGGGHFNVLIESSAFKDKSRMEMHRLVYDALEDLIPKKIHALSIKTAIPNV
tara:strand:+ start:20641 stop:20892 length:252 start_codon:yes stop_codon:yes gene_type:complete